MIKVDKQHLSLLVGLFFLYLAIKYWDTLMKVLGTIMHAALPLFIGCVIAYVVNLPLKVIEKRFERHCHQKWILRYKHVFSLILAYLIIFILISLVGWIVVPELINCLSLLFSGHAKTIDHLTKLASENPEVAKYWKIANQMLQDGKFKLDKLPSFLMYGLGGTVKSVVSAANSVVSVGTNLLIGLVFSIYVLIFKEHLQKQALTLLRVYAGKYSKHFLQIIAVFNDSYSSYIVGQCKDAIVLGLLCLVAMLIFHLPYAAMISAVISFTALIPIIGAILGALVGVIIIFTVSPFKAIIFLIILIVLQQIDNRVTYPLIVGKSIGLPSVWVFAAVMIGGGVWGIWGMMFTVPLFSALYRLITDDIAQREEQSVKSDVN